MPTLLERDDKALGGAGVLVAGPGEIEYTHRRTRHCRVYRLDDTPDGRRRFRIGGAIEPVHYQADPLGDPGQAWEEIDLALAPTPKADWDYACETNGYQVRVWQSRLIGGKRLRYIAQVRRAGCSFGMAPLCLVWENDAGERQVVARPKANVVPVVDNEAHHITWADAFGPGIDFRYNLWPDRFFKVVIVRSREALPKPTIGAKGLRLTVVMGLSWEGARPDAIAQGVTVGELATSELSAAAAQEEHIDPEPFAQRRDGDGREALWVQKPRAWATAGEAQAELPMTWRLQRREGQVVGLFSVAEAELQGAGYPVYIDTAISEEQVGAGTDDSYSYGETYPGTIGAYGLTSTQLAAGELSNQFLALGQRFTTVPIPQGATIDSAALSWLCSASSSSDTHLRIYAENSDDAATFNVSGHTPADSYSSRTSASAEWDISTTAWTADTWYTSADCSGAVEEVVAREGWASGNAIILVVVNNSLTAEGGSRYRSARAYERTGNVSGPKFNCSYTEGAAAQTAYPAAVSRTPIAYAPTASPGAVTASPAVATSVATAFGPTAEPGSVAALTELAASVAVAYDAGASPGSVTASPASASRAATVFAATAIPAAVTASPAMASRTAVAFIAAAYPGAVTALPEFAARVAAAYHATGLPGPVTAYPGLAQSPAVAHGVWAYDPDAYVFEDLFDSQGRLRVDLLASQGRLAVGYYDSHGRLRVGYLDSQGRMAVTYLDSQGRLRVDYLDSQGRQ